MEPANMDEALDWAVRIEEKLCALGLLYNSNGPGRNLPIYPQKNYTYPKHNPQPVIHKNKLTPLHPKQPPKHKPKHIPPKFPLQPNPRQHPPFNWSGILRSEVEALMF